MFIQGPSFLLLHEEYIKPPQSENVTNIHLYPVIHFEVLTF